ncbi:MAG: phage-shock protein [Desulfobulbaceae bacterium]|nr:MAG: phage-shock protein [Desulfobulbaceae bacterium]
MSTIVIVAIVFGSIVTIAGLLCGTILVILRMRQTGVGGTNREQQKNEARIIQEIYQGLEQMEQRIDALETILMEGHNAQEKANHE